MTKIGRSIMFCVFVAAGSRVHLQAYVKLHIDSGVDMTYRYIKPTGCIYAKGYRVGGVARFLGSTYLHCFSSDPISPMVYVPILFPLLYVLFTHTTSKIPSLSLYLSLLALFEILRCSSIAPLLPEVNQS